MSTVIFHPSIRRFTDNEEKYCLDYVGTLHSCLSSLCEKFSLLKRCIFSNEGAINSYMNIYVNDKDYKTYPADYVIAKDDIIEIIIPLVGG